MSLQSDHESHDNGSDTTMHVDRTLCLTDLPDECIQDCAAPGRVDEVVAFWREQLGFTVNRDRAILCLAGYGSWTRIELAASTDDELADRILWLACGDFCEYIVHCADAGIDPRGDRPEEFDPPSGSDIFVLE